MDKNKMAGLLAFLALAGFLGAFAYILVWPIPEDNKDLVNIALMALIGFVGTGVGYYLGSSLSSARKTDVIEKLSAPPDEKPPLPRT